MPIFNSRTVIFKNFTTLEVNENFLTFNIVAMTMPNRCYQISKNFKTNFENFRSG